MSSKEVKIRKAGNERYKEKRTLSFGVGKKRSDSYKKKERKTERERKKGRKAERKEEER